MWPTDTGSNCLPVQGKENILVCRALLPWIIFLLPPLPLLVGAMPACFSCTIQILVLWWALLFKWGNCPLWQSEAKGDGWGWMDGQKVKEESHICLPTRKRHIKASFRSCLICVFLSFYFLSCMDRGTAVWTERGHHVCRGRGRGVDRREEFGDFLGGQNKNERAFVLFAGVGAPRAECSLHIYWGRMNIWLMSHGLRGNVGRREWWLYKARWSPSHTHTHTDIYHVLSFSTAV